MLFKFILFFFLFLSSLFSFSQTNFDKGFYNGFKEGYCHDKGIGCLEPIPPIAPVPKIAEDSNDYMDGYNRGFKEGIEKRKKDERNSTVYKGRETKDTKTNSSEYKTSKPEFTDHTYKPNLDLQVLVAKAKINEDNLAKKLYYLVLQKTREIRNNISDEYYKSRFSGEISVLESMNLSEIENNPKLLITRAKAILNLINEYNSRN
jgi:hypothetical protein